jgi:DNA-binding YbaB/EbfC family protein
MFNKDMLDKLSTIKAQAEESKERLEGIEISEESGGGLVRVTMNGNRKIKDVTINADLKMIDKEELEDLLVLAIDKTLKSVNELNEKEVMNSASSLFPGM